MALNSARTLLRPKASSFRALSPLLQSYSTANSSPAQPPASPFAPRHLLSIADLTPDEITTLVRNAARHKRLIKSGQPDKIISNALKNQTVAITFSKRSTRTRISTEGAVVAMGGHPMFLGSQDIQLGVNESLYDTSVVISSMVSAIVARVGPHSDVADLAKHSSVPVINALSDLYHPMQIIADLLTIFETIPSKALPIFDLGVKDKKIAWIGDANNVLFDLAIACQKLGMKLSIATPNGYLIPEPMRQIILDAAKNTDTPGQLTETTKPEEAVKDADFLVTDTWVSMGQEEEKVARLKAFEGYQITEQMAKDGGAKSDWQFLHCLPRKPEEVADEVFYGPRSLVFREAENRLWAAIAVLEAFVLNKGKITKKGYLGTQAGPK